MAATPLHPFFDELKRAPSVEYYLRQFLLGGQGQGQGHHPRSSPEKGTYVPSLYRVVTIMWRHSKQ